MKNYVLLLAFCLLSFQTVAHDMKMAFYKFENHNGQLSLTVTYDKAHIVEAIKEEIGCNTETKLSLCANQYFKENFQCIINNKNTFPSFKSAYSDKEYIHLVYLFEKNPETITSMKIVNDCLINQYKDYQNIIKFNFLKQKRSFRMSSKRKQITMILK